MANGLPVITTPNCASGVHLIENNVNGFICETNEHFFEKIHYLFNHEEVSISLGEKSLLSIQNYTTEMMADSFFPSNS
jgi:glycosyltransferase involved in cell wall biosynthesis